MTSPSHSASRRTFSQLAEFATELIDRMQLREITPEQALAEWREVRAAEEGRLETVIHRDR